MDHLPSENIVLNEDNHKIRSDHQSNAKFTINIAHHKERKRIYRHAIDPIIIIIVTVLFGFWYLI